MREEEERENEVYRMKRMILLIEYSLSKHDVTEDAMFECCLLSQAP